MAQKLSIRERAFDGAYLLWQRYEHEDLAMRWQVVGVHKTFADAQRQLEQIRLADAA